MGKINDPRTDTAAVAMRTLRAQDVYNKIKKRTNLSKKFKSFNEDKLDLDKTDLDFYDNFVSCDESIKQELIFLWEEVGLLSEIIEKEKEKQEEQKQEEQKQEQDYVVLNLESNKLYKPEPPNTDE